MAATGRASDGFASANIVTGFLDDPKIRKLQRLAGDDAPACVVLYLATLLASWREGRQLTAHEAENLVEPTEDRLRWLAQVRLLDSAGRIPANAWERHFGPVRDLRDKRRNANPSGGPKPSAEDPPAGGGEDPPGEPEGTHMATQEATHEATQEAPITATIVTPYIPTVVPDLHEGFSDGQSEPTALPDEPEAAQEPDASPDGTHEATHMATHEDEADEQSTNAFHDLMRNAGWKPPT